MCVCICIHRHKCIFVYRGIAADLFSNGRNCVQSAAAYSVACYLLQVNTYIH